MHAVTLLGEQHPPSATHESCWPQLLVAIAPQSCPVQAATLFGVQHPASAAQVICWLQLLVTVAPQICPVHAARLLGMQPSQPPSATHWPPEPHAKPTCRFPVTRHD